MAVCSSHQHRSSTSRFLPRRFRRATATLIALCVVAAASCLAPPSPAAAADRPAGALDGQLAAAVGQYAKVAKASAANAGVAVIDLATGKTVYAHQADELLMPASNQKLLTGSFALARLGGDFQFVTRACLVGNDLWVIGSGDPTLGDPVIAKESGGGIYDEMDRWAAAIKAACPSGIAGDILLCPAFSGDQKSPLESYRNADWPKNQYHDWYCAPVGPLNFNNNCIDVTFGGDKKEITPILSPQSRFWQLVNKTTKGAKQTWGLQLSEDDAVVTIKGTVTSPSSDPQFTAVNNPLLFFGRVLADRLVGAGVSFKGKIAVGDFAALASLKDARELCRTVAPLPAVMKRANKHSLNMAAECIFLRAGDGTWAGSASLMAGTLAREYGIDAKGLAVQDGGGLSREDKVSPATIARLLTAVAKRKDAQALLDSLPISGTDGTLARRFKDAPSAKGRVLGKTGYIAGVSALSGYVLDKDRKPAYVFSVLVNRVGDLNAAKKLEESVCTSIIAAIDK